MKQIVQVIPFSPSQQTMAIVPLLVIHVVQKYHTGEQKMHWDSQTNKNDHKIWKNVSFVCLALEYFFLITWRTAIKGTWNQKSKQVHTFWFTLNYIFVSEMGTMDFLELRYRVEWPVNIVITEKSVVKYNKVSLSWW